MSMTGSGRGDVRCAANTASRIAFFAELHGELEISQSVCGKRNLPAVSPERDAARDVGYAGAQPELIAQGGAIDLEQLLESVVRRARERRARPEVRPAVWREPVHFDDELHRVDLEPANVRACRRVAETRVLNPGVDRFALQLELCEVVEHPRRALTRPSPPSLRDVRISIDDPQNHATFRCPGELGPHLGIDARRRIDHMCRRERAVVPASGRVDRERVHRARVTKDALAVDPDRLRAGRQRRTVGDYHGGRTRHTANRHAGL